MRIHCHIQLVSLDGCAGILDIPYPDTLNIEGRSEGENIGISCHRDACPGAPLAVIPSPVPQICSYFSEQYAVQPNSPAYRKWTALSALACWAAASWAFNSWTCSSASRASVSQLIARLR